MILWIPLEPTSLTMEMVVEHSSGGPQTDQSAEYEILFTASDGELEDSELVAITVEEVSLTFFRGNL
jgi:hypothetical protein